MSLHEQSVGATDEWYTPLYVFQALNCVFDLDVSSPLKNSFSCVPAKQYITAKENGLTQSWHGFVWMNPPFGTRNGLVPWLEKFLNHKNGIALVPDRTSAPWWQNFAYRMELILFVSPKIKFIDVNGNPGTSPAQGTCLLGLGKLSHPALHHAAQKGLGKLFTPIL